jgi:outer membrane protein assembly factor BamB
MQSFDAATGKQLWSASLVGQFFLNAMPSALGGKVYVTAAESGVTLYAFDESNGALLWTRNAQAGDDGGPAVTPTGVYVAGPQQAFAYDPNNGNLLWSNLLGGDGGGGAVPVVAGGLAFMPDGFGSYNGQVINASSGAVAGSYVADCPPAITATTGYFLQQGTLRGLQLSNNQILWSFAGDGSLTTSPIAVNGYVFIGSSSGNLYGLDASTGVQVWKQSLGTAIPQGATWGHSMPYSGMNAGDGLLVVPAGNTLTAFRL